LAVKITQMGPEVHAAYVKEKRTSTARDENRAGDSSAGNMPGIMKRIPLLRDMTVGKEERVADVNRDPRLNKQRFLNSYLRLRR